MKGIEGCVVGYEFTRFASTIITASFFFGGCVRGYCEGCEGGGRQEEVGGRQKEVARAAVGKKRIF